MGGFFWNFCFFMQTISIMFSLPGQLTFCLVKFTLLALRGAQDAKKLFRTHWENPALSLYAKFVYVWLPMMTETSCILYYTEVFYFAVWMASTLNIIIIINRIILCLRAEISSTRYVVWCGVCISGLFVFFSETVLLYENVHKIFTEQTVSCTYIVYLSPILTTCLCKLCILCGPLGKANRYGVLINCYIFFMLHSILFKYVCLKDVC